MVFWAYLSFLSLIVLFSYFFGGRKGECFLKSQRRNIDLFSGLRALPCGDQTVRNRGVVGGCGEAAAV